MTTLSHDGRVLWRTTNGGMTLRTLRPFGMMAYTYTSFYINILSLAINHSVPWH